jgi:chemotaxis protein CheD
MTTIPSVTATPQRAVSSRHSPDSVLAVVELGGMYVTRRSCEVLVTHALGSCLGVAVYDPVARAGGLLHAMMPESSLDEEAARRQPGLFVDTGIPALFRACYALGARKDRLLVRLAGAGAMHAPDRDQFGIGRRNLLLARQLLWRNGVLVHGQDVGGTTWRDMSLSLADGAVVVRSTGSTIQL